MTFYETVLALLWLAVFLHITGILKFKVEKADEP